MPQDSSPKRGRPTLAPAKRRTVSVKSLFTEEEAARLHSISHKTDRPVSDILREAFLRVWDRPATRS
jgi:hypothetical protein